MAGGGIGNAVVGTLVVVGIASLISVPVGILGAVFLAEFGRDSWTAAAVRGYHVLRPGRRPRRGGREAPR